MFIFLSLTFVNKIAKWGASRHYMICKIYYVFVSTCFKSIEKHVARPKHAQNLQKQQLDSVVQKTCMFWNFCLIICTGFTCWVFLNKFKWCTLFVLGMESTWINPFLVEFMRYLPSNVKFLHIFKDKKSKQNITWKTMTFKLNCWVSKF